MRPTHGLVRAVVAGLIVLPAPALAKALSVEVWTDRGYEGVYQPGEPLEIKARSSSDAYLLVYEIDAEGHVNLLFPRAGMSSEVESRRTYELPEPESSEQLVVEGPTGQGYIVAIASADPFQDLPWYLRPYDSRAQQIGYEGRPSDESDDEGVTTEGRIVGDPFVAMERIRRKILPDPEDDRSFATAYTTYYVHERVGYPRYLCNDCHRPGHWAWWDGFDPYYTQCSVFDLRINWAWGWGRSYWFGYVPYYVYAYRPGCAPRYRSSQGAWCSSWDGWSRWQSMWGRHLVRYKSPPPQGYVPPSKFDQARRGDARRPPGFLAGDPAIGVRGRADFPRGRSSRVVDPDPGLGRMGRAEFPRGRSARVGDRDPGLGRMGRGDFPRGRSSRAGASDPAPRRVERPWRGPTELAVPPRPWRGASDRGQDRLPARREGRVAAPPPARDIRPLERPHEGSQRPEPGSRRWERNDPSPREARDGGFGRGGGRRGEGRRGD